LFIIKNPNDAPTRVNADAPKIVKEEYFLSFDTRLAPCRAPHEFFLPDGRAPGD
jgi:hypothetical protein